MGKPIVIILMGSNADMDHCEKISEACLNFGIETIMRIGSAHKTAEHTLSLLRQFERDERPKVYITVAGRSNALSGFTDGFVSAPVIACPPPSDAFGGLDVISSIRMPSGVAPALVMEPINAALLTAKIFGQFDQEIRARVIKFQQGQSEKIIADNERLSR